MESNVKPKVDQLQDGEVKKSTHRKYNKPAVLTKKEKKEMGIGKDEAKAILRYARISSRKVKIVIDLIKNKELDEAYGILRYTPKAASSILYKLLKSAEANAEMKELDRESLYVESAYANQGPTLKRVMPRAQGRAFKINKRTSHITVVLKEKES